MINGYLAENNVTLKGDFPWEEDQDAQVRGGHAVPWPILPDITDIFFTKKLGTTN